MNLLDYAKSNRITWELWDLRDEFIEFNTLTKSLDRILEANPQYLENFQSFQLLSLNLRELSLTVNSADLLARFTQHCVDDSGSYINSSVFGHDLDFDINAFIRETYLPKPQTITLCGHLDNIVKDGDANQVYVMGAGAVDICNDCFGKISTVNEGSFDYENIACKYSVIRGHNHVWPRSMLALQSELMRIALDSRK